MPVWRKLAYGHGTRQYQDADRRLSSDNKAFLRCPLLPEGKQGHQGKGYIHEGARHRPLEPLQAGEGYGKRHIPAGVARLPREGLRSIRHLAPHRQGRNNKAQQMEEITRQEIEEALDRELWNEWYADLLLLVE